MKTILVVDDSQINRFLLREILKVCGNFKVLEAANGSDAIKQVENNHIDLIFMDIQMPIMGGVEATNHLRTLSLYRGVIIGITAYDNYEHMIQCGEGSFNEMYVKPIKIERVKKLLEKYSLVVQPG